MPGFMVQGGKGGLESRAQDMARGGRGLSLGRRLSRWRPIGGHGATIAIVWVALSRHYMVATLGSCHN